MRAPAGTHGRGAAPAARRHALQGRCRWSTVALAAIVAASALAQCSPAAVGLLEFSRAGIEAGQWWPAVTGNFVHYDWTHLAVNLGTFAVLCWLVQSQLHGAVWVVGLSAVAVGAATYFCAGGVAVYRGISGVDCGLLAWLLARRAMADGGRRAGAWLGLLVVVAGKFCYELLTGTVLLPTSAPHGVAVVGVTHVAGLIIGSAGALAGGRRTPKRGRSPRASAVDVLTDRVRAHCVVAGAGRRPVAGGRETRPVALGRPRAPL